MKINIKMLLTSITMVAALGFANVNSIASEPEKVNFVKATFDASELKRNLGPSKLHVKSDPTEKVSFKVQLDKAGEIQELTYSHNITSEKQEKLDAYIQKAYMAIMSTSFFPAKKDGSAVDDTLTIDFELVN